MEMKFQAISPLWETFPSRQVQQTAEKNNGIFFADIFRSAIENVREAEDKVAKTEYLLSTGQLDNPAEVNMATYEAETAMSMLVELRERAMNVYSELTRISL